MGRSSDLPGSQRFRRYNVVDEWNEPDSVLKFVVGSSATRALIDQSPIVMWQFRESKPAQLGAPRGKNGAQEQSASTDK
jgi:hypothetical protein